MNREAKKTRSKCKMCDINGKIHIPKNGHLSFPNPISPVMGDPLMVEGPKVIKCPYCKPDKYKPKNKKKIAA